MKILVTGGAGFIGHHAVKALLEGGHKVCVYDNFSTGKRDHIPEGIHVVEADVLDRTTLGRAMDEFRPEAVLHLAARVSIRASVDQFTEDAMQNLIGTLRVLEAAIASGARRFVLASSMAVYADSPDPRPLNEDWPKKPLSPYGISKHAAEQMVHIMGRQAKIETMALRFFNTYGTGQTLTPYVGVMTIFVNRILEGQPPVIFGDGNQCRDFVYVGDIARACRLALESRQSGDSINIGSGRGTTVNQLTALLLQQMGSSLKPEYAPARAEELQNSVAQISRARELLGYSPQGLLEEKMAEVIGAIRDQRELAEKER